VRFSERWYGGTIRPVCLSSRSGMRSKESEHLSLNTCVVASLPRVIPNSQGLDLFNAYEVDFGNQLVAILYESRLQLATKANPLNRNSADSIRISGPNVVGLQE